MSTYYDAESGEYRNFENEVIAQLKLIAGVEDEEPAAEEPVVEEPVDPVDDEGNPLPDPEIPDGTNLPDSPPP